MRAYRIINMLSLDVTLGAIVVAWFVSRQLGITPRIQGIVVLGLAVWIVYTVDRLLDIRHLLQLAATERHRYHQRNRVTLWVMVSIAIILAFSMLFSMRGVVIKAGLILALVVGIYIFFQKLLPVKEFVIALLYTAGVLIPSVAIRSIPLLTNHYLIILQVYFLALINLLIFAWMETKSDQQDGHLSFTIRWGRATTVRVLNLLFIISFALSAFLFIHDPTLSTSVFGIMNMLLFLIFKQADYFSLHDRYRLWGDGVFLIPLITLFQ